jgi:hypothetical protein
MWTIMSVVAGAGVIALALHFFPSKISSVMAAVMAPLDAVKDVLAKVKDKVAGML